MGMGNFQKTMLQTISFKSMVVLIGLGLIQFFLRVVFMVS